MGEFAAKMSVRTRIALVPVVAAALCLLAVSANQDMDERAVIADLVKEAAGAYTTAASAAVTALAEAEKNQPSKEDKIQECICAARGTAGDPCVEASMDDAAEKKMREEFANSCNQELAQMPGSMKETILAECVKRRTESAGLKFENPKDTEAVDAARVKIAADCDEKASKEAKGKTLNIVEQPEEQLLACMCERAGCMSDEDREVFDDAVTDATKKCKKTVALEIAEAMGDDESEEAEQPSREEMAEKVSECVCDSKKEAGHPCLNDEEWAARKEELKVIQAQCRKPLHDEL